MKLHLRNWIIGALLVLLTALTWNHRFEVSDHPLNATLINEELLAKAPEERRRHCSIQKTPDGEILHVERKEGGGNPTISISLGDLEDVHFIYFECDYRWTNISEHDNSWMLAQGIVSDTLSKGNLKHPPESMLFNGAGTRDWTELKLVRELTAPIKETHFNFSSRGKTGFIDLRNIRFSKVSERSWVPLACVLLMLGWITFAFHLLRRNGVSPTMRTGAASLLLITAAWVGVFPRTNTLLVPILGDFALVLPEIPEKPTIEAKPAATEKTLPSPPESVLQKKADSSDSRIKPHEKRPPSADKKPPKNKGVFHTKFFKFIHCSFWMHLPAFAALSWLWFLVTGQAKSWPFIVALAVLAEAISPLTLYGFDPKDIIDLVLNLLGVALGFMVWRQSGPTFRKLQQTFRAQKA